MPMTMPDRDGVLHVNTGQGGEGVFGKEKGREAKGTVQ